MTDIRLQESMTYAKHVQFQNEQKEQIYALEESNEALTQQINQVDLKLNRIRHQIQVKMDQY